MPYLSYNPTFPSWHTPHPSPVDPDTYWLLQPGHTAALATHQLHSVWHRVQRWASGVITKPYLTHDLQSRLLSQLQCLELYMVLEPKVRQQGASITGNLITT
jgi:hypothetical protein